MLLRIIIILFIFLMTMMGYSQVTLEGRIYGEGNMELYGANIYLPELDKGTSTDETGYFKLPGLPQGRFTLRVSYLGYETVIQTIDINDSLLLMGISLDPSVFHSEEVVISGGRPSSQHENAIKIETMSSEQLIVAGTPSLMRSIARIPGVDLISKGEGVTTPVIRGLSTSNILVLNNGVRMESFQFSENHPYLIDESGMDQVEIIKGPASLLYGSDAMGGVLNFIPEKNSVSGTIEGTAGLQYHSNTNGYNGSLGIKGSQGRWTWGTRGSVKSHMDYLQGNDEPVPNSRFNQAYLKAFTGYSTSHGIFRLSYEYTKMKLGMSVEPVMGEITHRGRWNDLWYQDLGYHLLSSRNTLFFKVMKLGVNLAYQDNQRRLFTKPDDEEFKRVDTRLKTFSYEAKTTITPGEISNFIIGVQGMTQSNRNLEAPDHVLPDYALNDIAIYGLVQHDFRNKIHLQAGLRFDNRFLDIPEQERHGHSHEEEHGEDEEEEIMEELVRYYGNLSGSLGVTYDVSGSLLFRANISSAYRAPNVAELTQDGPHIRHYS